MAEPALLQVEVVLAEAGALRRASLEVPVGTSTWQAVGQSGLLAGREDLDVAALGVAVFGRLVDRDRPLEDGDRVEVLRPLPQDPKLRRRRLAQQGGTMGRGPGRR